MSLVETLPNQKIVQYIVRIGSKNYKQEITQSPGGSVQYWYSKSSTTGTCSIVILNIVLTAHLKYRTTVR
jgi:hypothetical protein